MATLTLRYIHSFVDKTGRVRSYFRYRGRRWPLPGPPGSAEFSRRYDELRLTHVKPGIAPSRLAFGPGTLGWIIEQWTASKDFETKASSTRARYRRVLDLLRERYGRGLLVDLRERHVRAMRAEFMTSTSTADLVVILISNIWVFAKEVLALELGPNPTSDIRSVHKKKFEYEPWPEAVIAAFEEKARPRQTMPLALLLLLFSGQRIGDVAAMRWSQYDGRGIAVRQEKTGELLWIPCHRRLKDALTLAPRRSAFILTTQMGAGYTSDSLSNAFTVAIKAIGAKGFSAHGLRKNAGIALAEAGCTDKEIMAVLGHRTYVQSHAYTRRAQQKVLALQAIEKRERADEVANPGTKEVTSSG